MPTTTTTTITTTLGCGMIGQCRRRMRRVATGRRWVNGIAVRQELLEFGRCGSVAFPILVHVNARVTIAKQNFKSRLGSTESRHFALGLGFKHAVVAFIIANPWDGILATRGRRLSLCRVMEWVGPVQKAREKTPFHPLSRVGKLNTEWEVENSIGQIKFRRVQIEVTRRHVEAANLI
jgi:hypothetical protein